MRLIDRRFAVGVLVGVMCVFSLGAMQGKTDRQRYLEACQALQGEQAYRMVPLSIAGNEKKNFQRIKFWMDEMDKFNP
ncbi:MAG: hypothetical protein AAFP69_01925 [Planctomycetota bacterium]